MGKNKGKLSRSGLAIRLSAIKGFESPKVSIEQYVTDSEIAATILWDAYIKGDIYGKVVVDLGCGTGILGIGAELLGASKVYFIESESSAMSLCKDNEKRFKEEFGSSESESSSEFFFGDVADFMKKGDTVVMNPPFGVKSEHSDRKFLEKAFEIASVVYSFHKSETKRFIEGFSKKKNFIIDQVIDFSWPLKASMGFHKKKIERINVSCFRFVNKE